MPAGVIAGERIRALAGEGVPGVVVLVAGPEGVQAAGTAGLADIAGRVPASPGMVCPWFSMTKIATATAAMRRAEPVRWVHPADQPAPDPDKFLRGLLARHARLRFAPGSRASYSNLGPLVLAAALGHRRAGRTVDLAAALPRRWPHAARCCGVSAGAGCKACRVRDFVTLSGATGTVAVMRTGKLASSGDRAETVLLTGCCERRRHVMYQVLNTPTGLVVDAPLRAVGRKRATWTPQRRELADGSAVR